MSDYNWCHGPKCHTSHTLDRIRGVKGSKVLRTRKVPINNWNSDNHWKYFCSQGCMHDFIRLNIEEFVALHPRTEALETPIEDPKKTTTITEYGYTYTNTEIKVDESRQS
jgi:hypothetical protein